MFWLLYIQGLCRDKLGTATFMASVQCVCGPQSAEKVVYNVSQGDRVRVGPPMLYTAHRGDT